jgi:hypothetical protein
MKASAATGSYASPLTIPKHISYTSNVPVTTLFQRLSHETVVSIDAVVLQRDKRREMMFFAVWVEEEDVCSGISKCEKMS